jgi:hypothetical protein
MNDNLKVRYSKQIWKSALRWIAVIYLKLENSI